MNNTDLSRSDTVHVNPDHPLAAIFHRVADRWCNLLFPKPQALDNSSTGSDCTVQKSPNQQTPFLRDAGQSQKPGDAPESTSQGDDSRENPYILFVHPYLFM